MLDRRSVLKHVRMERPARLLTTTMEIRDPDDITKVLFRVALSISADDLPTGISIDGVRFDWTDRRGPRAAARAEGPGKARP